MATKLKLIAEQASLSKALELVGRIVERRNTIPILSHMLLRAENGLLTLRSTNLDMEVQFSVPVAIEIAGATTANADLFASIVKRMPEGSQIQLEADGEHMKVSSGKTRMTLNTLDASDYPVLTVTDFPTRARIPATILRKMFNAVAFAISTEETRYYLNGVYLHVRDNKLVAVATDGHRLSKVQIECPDGLNYAGNALEKGIIIPREAVYQIQNMVKTGDAETILEISETKFRLTIGELSMVSKLIDGTFPDYARVIPSGSNKTATVEKDGMASAAERVSLISAEKGRAIKITFDAGTMKLDVVNPDAGSGSDELEIGYDADPIEIGFNSKYLAEALRALFGDTVTIQLTDPGSPTIFHGGRPDEHLLVMMPMRV